MTRSINNLASILSTIGTRSIYDLEGKYCSSSFYACPFVVNHIVRGSNLARHLISCRYKSMCGRHGEIEKERTTNGWHVCTFNSNHICHTTVHAAHELNCVNKYDLLKRLNDDGRPGIEISWRTVMEAELDELECRTGEI